jgi:hypothetical protein
MVRGPCRDVWTRKEAVNKYVDMRMGSWKADFSDQPAAAKHPAEEARGVAAVPGTVSQPLLQSHRLNQRGVLT